MSGVLLGIRSRALREEDWKGSKGWEGDVGVSIWGGRFGRVLSILGVDVLCRRAWVCRRLNSWRGIGAREHVSR